MNLMCVVLPLGTLFSLVASAGAAPEAQPPMPKYYVDSPLCQMPYVDPFSRDVMAIYTKDKEKACHNDSELVTAEYDPRLEQYRVHTRGDLASKMAKENVTLECGYQKIYRDENATEPDNTYKMSKMMPLPDDLLLPKDVEYIATRCLLNSKNHKSKITQKDALTFVQDHLSYADLVRAFRLLHDEEEPKPHVIILGIDSTSRINLRRTMPQVLRFLRESSRLVRDGGLQQGGRQHAAQPAGPSHGRQPTWRASRGKSFKVKGYIDSLNYIWQRFKEAGYTTAYAEDCESLSTFNYEKPGFIRKPVDHYLRPFVRAIEKTLRLERRHGIVFCVGRHMSSGYVWDFAVQFVERFLQRSPMFGLFWSNSFTHNSFIGAAAMDHLLREYLQLFQKLGLFKRSIVLLVSDHGYRFGDIRTRTSSGYLEERLPMLWLYAPPWFHQKYPHYVANLRKNRNRLSSNYDLHMTLQHLLQLNTASPEAFDPRLKAKKCPSCQSLFFELPENRSCSDAGITEKWCTCHPATTVTNRTHYEAVARAVVQQMNEHLVARKLTNFCENFKLKEVKVMDRKQILGEKTADAAEEFYILNFSTVPKKPQFEATIQWNPQNNTLTMNVDELSRKNSYKDTAKCTDDPIVKKYCICKKGAKKHK
ncbi:GL22506 [Drosophila persimilis]|uniref:GL22506 n=1 Tax=Drosophila persimilis TaxID=7234 RepID=B4H1C8_DROPE|nr:GL22506 [Drosophila persimilis]